MLLNYVDMVVAGMDNADGLIRIAKERGIGYEISKYKETEEDIALGLDTSNWYIVTLKSISSEDLQIMRRAKAAQSIKDVIINGTRYCERAMSSALGFAFGDVLLPLTQDAVHYSFKAVRKIQKTVRDIGMQTKERGDWSILKQKVQALHNK